jgi:hypothetical protein
MTYQIDSETIEAEDDWGVEFEPDEVEQVPALEKLEIDAGLCETVTIIKAEDGRFFATWHERHPELGTYDDYFPRDGYAGESAKWTKAREKKWRELTSRMPWKDYAEEISRQDAYAIIAWFWLPKEFHAEAGV